MNPDVWNRPLSKGIYQSSIFISRPESFFVVTEVAKKDIGFVYLEDSISSLLITNVFIFKLMKYVVRFPRFIFMCILETVLILENIYTHYCYFYIKKH